tara:strand:+ start:4608 stop:4841 length:234 start_codon:yes stop_codon:yes gene_type:complete
LKTLYTIGHSNHAIADFVSLLQLHKIEAIADVRSAPYSRYNPQFSKEALQQSLKGYDIAYVFPNISQILTKNSSKAM